LFLNGKTADCFERIANDCLNQLWVKEKKNSYWQNSQGNLLFRQSNPIHPADVQKN
jgi:hypothetical protein